MVTMEMTSYYLASPTVFLNCGLLFLSLELVKLCTAYFVHTLNVLSTNLHVKNYLSRVWSGSREPLPTYSKLRGIYGIITNPHHPFPDPLHN